MFTRRGGNTPAQPASPTSPAQSPTQPNQIPFVNPAPDFGLEDLEDKAPPPTLEEVLADPTKAENTLYAALTVRALKWLEFLEQDESLNPQPGKRLVTLDTQVSMFKVIAEWLKTSKKTKEAGEDEKGAPGIEQMREIIRQELEAKPTPQKKPSTFLRDDYDLDPNEDLPPRRVKTKAEITAAIKKKGSNTGDDRYLSTMLSRARNQVDDDED